MDEWQYWLNINNIKPIRYYAYKSGVDCKFLTQDHNYKNGVHDFLDNFGHQLKQKLKDSGFDKWDNKVVVECEVYLSSGVKSMSNIFIGRYDNIWSVGLGRYGDSWVKPINLKQ